MLEWWANLHGYRKEQNLYFQGKTMITYALIIFIAIAGILVLAFLANPADDWNDRHISWASIHRRQSSLELYCYFGLASVRFWSVLTIMKMSNALHWLLWIHPARCTVWASFIGFMFGDG
jgi:hypothetical protein